MMRTDENITCDAFLGGALDILQPKNGYRAATDPVFLAASIPASAGQSVLELGCGVGVALLCLGKRISELEISGLEIQEEYAELARQNAHANSIEAKIFSGDLMQMPRELLDKSFDHVIFNPPFYDAKNVSAPENAGKSQAHVMGLKLEDWVLTGLKRLKPKGRLTFIHRAEILPQALGCLEKIAGDIVVKPLTSRQDKPAKRVIVSCRKGTNGPFALHPPLVVHESSRHNKDVGGYSAIAQAVLRDAQALYL